MKKILSLLAVTAGLIALSFLDTPARAGNTGLAVNNLTGQLIAGPYAAGVTPGFIVQSGQTIEFASGATLKVDMGATLSGLLGGANNTLQYNNSGVLGGTAGMLWSGTALTNTQSVNNNLLLGAWTNSNGGTSAAAGIELGNSTHFLTFGIAGTAFSGSLVSGGPTGESTYIGSTGGLPISIAPGLTEVARFTTTGLNNAAIGTTTASTGSFTTLAASGIINATAGAVAIELSGSAFAGSSGGDLVIFEQSAGLQIKDSTGANLHFTITSSGAAFNGILGVGGAISASTNLLLPASTTGVSSLRIPQGVAPTAPVNGDVWTTSAGLFIRINGATVGPIS